MYFTQDIFLLFLAPIFLFFAFCVYVWWCVQGVWEGHFVTVLQELCNTNKVWLID